MCWNNLPDDACRNKMNQVLISDLPETIKCHKESYGRPIPIRPPDTQKPGASATKRRRSGQGAPFSENRKSF